MIRGHVVWLALVALLAAPALAMSATPEQIRECVERNLVKYSGPANAVAAQYADLETACIAALDGTGPSVGFTPDAGGAPATAAAPGGTGASPAEPEPAASPGSGSGRTPDVGGPPPAAPAPDRADPGDTADASASDLVGVLADSDPDTGSPVGGAGDLPGWLIVVLVAVGASALAVAGLQVLRRLR